MTLTLGFNKAFIIIGVHEVDYLKATSIKLASLAQKVEQINVLQTVGPKCKYCGENHEG